MLTFNPASSAPLPHQQAHTRPAAFSGKCPTAQTPLRFGSAQDVSNVLLSLAATGALGIAGWGLFDIFGSGSFTEKGKGKAMMKAIKNGNNKRAERLLKRGVSPTSVLLRSSFVVGNDYGHPFLEALRNENFELAQTMIDDYGVDISARNHKNVGPVSMGSTTMMDEALHTWDRTY